MKSRKLVQSTPGETDEKFAKSGDFCPNEACPDYGKVQEGQTQPNIRGFGRTRAGVQLYQCETYHRTFTETTGTLFFRKRTPEHKTLETLALLVEGSRISSRFRAKGIKEDTILAWLREAVQHAEELEDVLKVKLGQLDALWGYIRNKGEKNYPEDEELDSHLKKFATTRMSKLP
ncbi:MAG: hypothetical protein A2Z16_17680 [Chloroflexi bacterium RBG_16_54_18]|nr:MAG: hypothetical protein A2Z16_17680 [Chloroflexi bacterium RBG_16_54_18]